MYTYYKELENKGTFNIFLRKSALDVKEYLGLSVNEPSTSFYDKYQELFNALKNIDSLIPPEFTKSRSNEFYEKYGIFIIPPKEDEEYVYIESLKRKLNLNICDINDIISFYLNHIQYYQFVFPTMKEYFSKIERLLKEALDDLEKYRKIELPESNRSFNYTFPDTWFITPGGYLYNTGGKYGHKEGKLVYAYDRISKKVMGKFPQTLKTSMKLGKTLTEKDEHVQKKIVPTINNAKKIQTILQNGYVNYFDFQNYSNFPYRLLKLSGTAMGSVSYQKNIITLVVGYLSAVEALYKAYGRLNASSCIKKMFQKVEALAARDLSDILVRFAGFSKIETQCEKTITTSSIYGIELFKEYLDRGWNLNIIPGIIYDAYVDDVCPMDMNSVYIERHLDKALSEYHGKGKILINRGK